ncbi:MAG: hypothetical protein IV090_26580 [Candidatus Sericytochromatia bacterium]|nr:hypothetical protein [Candidatus Sericytochromatia bacterium]
MSTEELDLYKEIAKVSLENYKVEQGRIIEIYKHFVDISDKWSNRRHHINLLYTSVHSSSMFFFFYTYKDKANLTLFDIFMIPLMCIIGICLCIQWHRSLAFFKRLNTAKFKVVHKMESYLPIQCYKEEWDFLKLETKKHVDLTQINQGVALLLALPYLCFLIYFFLVIFIFSPISPYENLNLQNTSIRADFLFNKNKAICTI